jgi:hypothetical protein
MSTNLNVSWQNNHPILTWLPYQDSESYNVFRGTTKDNLVKIKNTTLLQYQDDIDIRDKFDRVKYFYQISSWNGKEETVFTDLVNYNVDLDYPYKGFTNEIVRRNQLVLDRIAGEEVDIYLKKGAGKRCERYNTVTKQHDYEGSLCDICYNTTFIGGFEKVTTKIRILNNVDSVQEMNYGIKLVSQRQGFLNTYPIVSNGDFIRTKRGIIYLVDDVKHKEFRGILHQQRLTLETLPTTSVYYNI